MKLLQNTSGQNLFFYLFIGVWTLLNLLNAAFTGLAHDEAYYWIYAENLDWGYFDHPPAVAAMIKAGYALFNNEFGVRLMNVLGSSLSLILLWNLCKRYGKDSLLFALLVGGLVVFHVYGFVIVPDSPLLIATVVYFWALEKYLEKDKLSNVLLLSVSIALLLYSKYHGLLILFFSILAFPKVLGKRSFWLTTLFSVVLFFPHLWWQVQNDFLTLRFHLFDRANKPYSISFTLNYLLGVLLISGPLLGLILWPVVFRVKTRSTWERVLRFNIVGFVLFFLWSSFSHKIEANWVSPIVVPMLILSYKYGMNNSNIRKWILILGGISLGLSLLFRIYAASPYIHNFLSEKFRVRNEFHNWEEWAQQIAERAEGKPVVFVNSYQQASKFRFYAGRFAHSYNTENRRRSQFDLLDSEAEVQGKDVLIVSEHPNPDMQGFETVLGEYYIRETNNFRSYSKVRINPEKDLSELDAGRSYSLGLKMENNFPIAVTFRENQEYPVQLVVSFYRQNELVEQQHFDVQMQREQLAPGESFGQQLEISIPEEEGKYRLFISFKSSWLPPGLNYSNQKLLIE